MRKFITYMIISALAVFAAKADAPAPDSLLLDYRNAATPADSLRALYNFFDLSQYHRRAHAGERLYELAQRIGNDSITLSVMRDITADLNLPDSTMQAMIARCESIPPSADRDQTLTILRVRLVAAHERLLAPMERRHVLQDLLTCLNSSDDNHDIYARIENLLKVTAMLGVDTQSDLLTDYYDSISSEIRLLPHEENRELIYVYLRRADEAYTLNGEYAKAVEAGESLLSVLGELKAESAQGNRPYNVYDNEYYEVYRRLLNNFQALDREHVVQYHDSLMAIVQRNADAYDDYHTNERAEIYYLMAMERYPEALKVLRRQVDAPHNAQYRRHLLRFMIDAAKATGNRELLLETSLAYNEMLEERLQNKLDERTRELEIIYNMADLNSKNQQLKQDRLSTQTRNTRIIVLLLAVLLLVLGTMTVVLLRQYRTSKSLAGELNLSNEMLRGERDNLKHVLEQLTAARDQAKTAERKKSDFVNNLLHEINAPVTAVAEYTRLIVDCIDEDKRKYMDRYSDLVLLNVELLQTIVNDLQEMAASDHSRIVAQALPMSVNAVCNMALAVVRPRLAPGVELVFTKDVGSDAMIISDKSRIGQVLINLLSNAAKFTDKGTITLDYKIDAEQSLISFSVTDTGIGIPEGKEKVIFNRFTKLDSHTQGLGLGLAICRLMAHLLHGTVELDTSYRRGARFVFTIPMKPGSTRRTTRD